MSVLLLMSIFDRYDCQVGENPGLINVALRLLDPHAVVIRPDVVGSHMLKGEEGERSESTVI